MLIKFELLYTIIRNRIHKYLTLLDKNIKIGNKTSIFYKSYIYNICDEGSVSIGDNCLIGRSKYGYHAGMPFYTTILNDGIKSNIRIGNNCRINGAYLHAKNNIKIGDNCVIASGVNIIDSNGHKTYSKDRTKGADCSKSVIIGNNVWIGLNATILKGTIIGDNSIISAGSVVKGIFPDNCIISGNPATIVKTFKLEEENIDKLL